MMSVGYSTSRDENLEDSTPGLLLALFGRLAAIGTGGGLLWLTGYVVLNWWRLPGMAAANLVAVLPLSLGLFCCWKALSMPTRWACWVGLFAFQILIMVLAEIVL